MESNRNFSQKLSKHHCCLCAVQANLNLFCHCKPLRYKATVPLSRLLPLLGKIRGGKKGKKKKFCRQPFVSDLC